MHPFYTSLSLVALLALLQVVLCVPVPVEESAVPHERARRAADPVLGHLTAEQPGIINEDRKSLVNLFTFGILYFWPLIH